MDVTYLVMGIGAALYLGGLVGVLYAKSRTGVVASAMVFIGGGGSGS